MKRFVFRLQSVLALRRQQRDERRRAYAELVMRSQELEALRGRVLAERLAQLDDLRSLSREGAFDVDAAAARRYYVSRLEAELRLHDSRRLELTRRVAEAHRALVEADRGVAALEKLEQRQRASFEAEWRHREALVAEEAWVVSRNMNS
jgi:flagellar export protein FliJ